jgi:hypothetical protein
MKKILILLFSCFAITANAQKSTLTIKFENFVKNEPVILNDKKYINSSGEEFNITLLKYFVSNFKLTKADGTEYVVPQDSCYFLVRENMPETKTITLKNLPKGNYTGLSYVIGVDSVRSASDLSQRTGTLDVGGAAKDMYWAWNSGYIFVKMEGNSDVISEVNKEYAYHIGMFGGIGDKRTLNNIRVATISFGTKPLKVGKASSAIASIKTDVSKIFDGQSPISIAKSPVVMGGPKSKVITDNYKTMFSLIDLKTL